MDKEGGLINLALLEIYDAPLFGEDSTACFFQVLGRTRIKDLRLYPSAIFCWSSEQSSGTVLPSVTTLALGGDADSFLDEVRTPPLSLLPLLSLKRVSFL